MSKILGLLVLVHLSPVQDVLFDIVWIGFTMFNRFVHFFKIIFWAFNAFVN